MPRTRRLSDTALAVVIAGCIAIPAGGLALTLAALGEAERVAVSVSPDVPSAPRITVVPAPATTEPEPAHTARAPRPPSVRVQPPLADPVTTTPALAPSTIEPPPSTTAEPSTTTPPPESPTETPEPSQDDSGLPSLTAEITIG